MTTWAEQHENIRKNNKDRLKLMAKIKEANPDRLPNNRKCLKRDDFNPEV